MSYRPTPWANLVRNQPDEARRQILTAYLATNGNATRAADHLGISHRSLLRYVNALTLANAIEEIRRAAGVA